MPQRNVWQLSADVGVGRIDGVEVLAEGLPTPRNPFVQRGAGDVLDALHQLDELVLGAGAHRCETDTAVPHHDRRHAVPARRCHLLVPAHLTVEVRMDVDETGRDHQAIGIDDSPGRPPVEPADLRDPAAADRQIAHESRAARAVNYARIGENDVVHERSP